MFLNQNNLEKMAESVAAEIQGSSRFLVCVVTECSIQVIEKKIKVIKVKWDVSIPGDEMISGIQGSFSDKYRQLVKDTVSNRLKRLGISAEVHFNNTSSCFWTTNVLNLS